MSTFAVTLKINAAAIHLGSSMYYANEVVYDGRGWHWDALDAKTKTIWIDRAAEFIKGLGPPAPTDRDARLLQFAPTGRAS